MQRAARRHRLWPRLQGQLLPAREQPVELPREIVGVHRARDRKNSSQYGRTRFAQLSRSGSISARSNATLLPWPLRLKGGGK
jgi:hypothetical protein